jgi:hypothetical protein
MNVTHTQARVLVLGLAAACLAAASPTPGRSASAADSTPSVAGPMNALGDGEQTPVAGSVSAPLRRARNTLAAAEVQIVRRRYGLALDALRELRVDLIQAHAAGMAQLAIRPADDDEDPPGPPAVFAIFGIEHRVTVRLAGWFDGAQTEEVLSEIRRTLRITHARRDAMLHAIIRREDDFGDGMADELPTYDTEVAVIRRALDEDELFGSARFGLESALARVQATQAKATRAFGGEE